MGGVDQAKVERDYELFLRELEEDPELRGNVNLYKADDTTVKRPQRPDEMDVDAATDDGEEEPDFPDVQLDELLNDFEDMSLSGDAEGTH